MSDLIGIGSSAISAYQRSLGVVSNNIANASTEGYTRRDVTLEAGPSQAQGTAFLGSGVLLSGIKRQFDAFVESNLRNSNSDLQSQKPVVDYTNRIVDVMGSESSGLGGALDRFFSSARSLAADPASTVLRSSFLRDSEGLASRFNQLSSQLDMVDSETRDAVSSDVKQINTLTSQLGAVNLQLSRLRDLASQPADLLDQRDRLLLDLSQFAKLNTQFLENGVVNVSLGASSTQEVVVKGKEVTPLGVNFDAATPERLSLVLDPYGAPQPLTGINSGDLAGLISFREQVLSSTRGALDTLATTLARELNAIHTSGVDALGQRGSDLFAFDSTHTHAAGALRVAINEPLKVCAAASFRVIESATNTGTEDATVRYSAVDYGGAPALSAVLTNNGNLDAARTISVSVNAGAAALTTVPAGMQDVSVYLDTLAPGQQLQLLTRDGRHLAGQTLSAQQQASLISTDSGFEAGASYSAAYLNQTSSLGYRQMDVSYGARADVKVIQQFDVNGNAIDPSLQKAMLLGNVVTTGESGLPAGNYFKLNGTTLGALTAANGNDIQASDVARWLNAAGVTGITASASTTIRVPTNQIHLGQSLTLNGVTITAPVGGFSNTQDLVNAINARSQHTGVQAGFSGQGLLVLSNAPGAEGKNIQVGNPVGTAINALGLSAQSYGGQVRIERAAGDKGNIELSLGALGSAKILEKMGLKVGITLPPQLQSAVLEGQTIAPGWANPVTGQYDLNGMALGPLTVAAGQTIQASDVAQWLNASQTSLSASERITATASNDIHVDISQLQLQEALMINGHTIGHGAGFASPQDLVNAINSGQSDVLASLGKPGEIVLTNAAGQSGRDIQIHGLTSNTKTPNALGLAGGLYGGHVTLSRAEGNTQSIELNIGEGGDAATLSRLGFRTQVHITGTAPDDVLLFVTGAGNAQVSASYTGQAADPIDRLRSSAMTLSVVSKNSTTGLYHYTLTDKATGTVLAERDIDPNVDQGTFHYQGLAIQFSKTPLVGDTFTIDGNNDGTGDNLTMLDVLALQNKAVVGDKTLHAAYIDHVNDMGNVAKQASIVQSSLKVVHDQAVSGHDQVSGVSLDEEATNLIRFQQAYQASAKVLQVATELFNSILQAN